MPVRLNRFLALDFVFSLGISFFLVLWLFGKRMNKRAVSYLKEVVFAVIKKQIEQSKWNVQSIKRLLIKDSTGFQIDESLSESYPGSGGDGSTASVRFQFEFDYLKQLYLLH